MRVAVYMETRRPTSSQPTPRCQNRPMARSVARNGMATTSSAITCSRRRALFGARSAGRPACGTRVATSDLRDLRQRRELLRLDVIRRGKLDVPGQAQPLEQPDHVVVDVDLPPVETDARRALEGVMVVVPAH